MNARKKMTTSQMKAAILPFLSVTTELREAKTCLEFPIARFTEGLMANAFYFNNKDWAQEYLTYCHRSESFKNRWVAACGDWNNKIVVDIGCGPGNIFATLKGSPKLLIGIDVAPTSLELSAKIGYLPILADANALPLKSGFADIVAQNATLHHCENISDVSKEAARLVKPGGLLVTDYDPQLSAWNHKGISSLLWNAHLIIYQKMGHGFHKTSGQQQAVLASEVHHKPGHGVTKELFLDVLKPLAFEVKFILIIMS